MALKTSLQWQTQSWKSPFWRLCHEEKSLLQMDATVDWNWQQCILLPHFYQRNSIIMWHLWFSSSEQYPSTSTNSWQSCQLTSVSSSSFKHYNKTENWRLHNIYTLSFTPRSMMNGIKRFTKNKDHGHQQGLHGHQGHALGMPAKPISHMPQQHAYNSRICYHGRFVSSDLSPSKQNGTPLDSCLVATTNMSLTSATIHRSRLEYLRHSVLPWIIRYWTIPSRSEEILTGDTFRGLK